MIYGFLFDEKLFDSLWDGFYLYPPVPESIVRVEEQYRVKRSEAYAQSLIPIQVTGEVAYTCQWRIYE